MAVMEKQIVMGMYMAVLVKEALLGLLRKAIILFMPVVAAAVAQEEQAQVVKAVAAEEAVMERLILVAEAEARMEAQQQVMGAAE